MKLKTQNTRLCSTRLTNQVCCIAVAADLTYILSGSSDKTIRIWNMQDKRQEAQLQGHTGNVLAVAITSDSKTVVSGSTDKALRIWSYEHKRQESILQGHTGSVVSPQ